MMRLGTGKNLTQDNSCQENDKILSYYSLILSLSVKIAGSNRLSRHSDWIHLRRPCIKYIVNDSPSLCYKSYIYTLYESMLCC